MRPLTRDPFARAPWETFACWYGLLVYLDEHSNIVHYQAPLDFSPVVVTIVRRFKNGKLRIQAPGGIAFTADKKHLDRFRWRQA